MKSIVMLMCGKNKLPHKAKAKDLYTSPRFQKSIEYAKTITAYSCIYILSAKYGLVELEQELAPYDKSLYEMSAQEKKEWAVEVVKSLLSISDPNTDKYFFLTDDTYNEYLLPLLSNYELPLKGIPQEEHITFYNNQLSDLGDG